MVGQKFALFRGLCPTGLARFCLFANVSTQVDAPETETLQKSSRNN